jgi:endonuclease YncB( thermonuclease family)
MMRPYVLIQGTFHVVNRTTAGRPTGFEPDGDSIHFKPARPATLDRLPVVVQPYGLSKIGSVLLRLEGIDALELHYRPDAGGPTTHQPRPLADQARDFLTGKLGLNPVPYTPPLNLRVKPPVEHDATPGFIVSRSLEAHGRPIAFAFQGAPPWADGSEIDLDAATIKRSVNYELLRAGQVYPLFYDGLPAVLRRVLAEAATKARRENRGLWPTDRTLKGLQVASRDDLERHAVIFPKLFRRLAGYLAEAGAPLGGFRDWLAARSEWLLDLTRVDFVGFEQVVIVQGNEVRMARKPEELVFVSER